MKEQSIGERGGENENTNKIVRENVWAKNVASRSRIYIYIYIYMCVCVCDMIYV